STQSLAELVDLYPTLADLCGLPAPDYLDGVSHRPVLNDPQASAREAAFTQVPRGNTHGYRLRTPRWPYPLRDNGNQGAQLYDMQADPQETHNLAADPQHASVVKDLQSRLKKYMP